VKFNKVQSVKNSVVALVEQQHTYCTGFFVKPTIILTATHCVKGMKKITIKTFNNKLVFTNVIKMDEKTDVAILQTENYKSKFIIKPAKYKPAVGDRIYLFGFPAMLQHVGKGMQVFGGTLANILKEEKYVVDTTLYFGNSGGPMLNSRWRYLGIVSAGYFAPDNDFAHIAMIAKYKYENK
jgi:serine protease Do